MNPPSDYPQNTAGAANPYPVGHVYRHCGLVPTYNTDDVAKAYQNWKATFVTASGAGASGNLRVQRPDNSSSPNDTVSEGIGYGMLISVYMNDKPVFDGFWSYAKSHFDGNGLMTWDIGSNNSAIGTGAATDGDEDMAWALIMAGVQWASDSYTSDAKTLLGNIYNHEVESGTGVLKPGDGFGGSSEMDPSYLAPAYYRVFATVTGNSGWMDVLNASYAILQKASGQYGLVPNWANSSGAGVAGPVSDGSGPYFGYDACRTPFRIALDYCLNGDGGTGAKDYLDKITGFYASQATSALSTLKDGYTTAGDNPPGSLGDNSAGMAFYGPGGVAAMEGGQTNFLRATYIGLVNQSTTNAMKVSGVYSYYHATWGVLSLLAMSGNFWDFTSP